jgi:hypothetical protein
MLVIYCMMHDTIMFERVGDCFVTAGDSFYSEIMNIKFTGVSISYFLVITLPCRILYWVYEVVHTFFVVTAQFAAFFTIIFWLFLLFYTFFIFEQHEHHFRGIRNTRARMEKELFELKSKNKKE